MYNVSIMRSRRDSITVDVFGNKSKLLQSWYSIFNWRFIYSCFAYNIKLVRDICLSIQYLFTIVFCVNDLLFVMISVVMRPVVPLIRLFLLTLLRVLLCLLSINEGRRRRLGTLLWCFDFWIWSSHLHHSWQFYLFI